MSQRVTISWVDSAGTNGWQHIEQVDPSPALCETTGYLVKETKDSYMVAMNRGCKPHQTAYGDYMVIPKCAVTKVRRIK